MKKLLTYFSFTLVLLVSLSLKAQTPSDLTHLVGEKASYLDQDMEKAGYKYVKTDKSGGDSYTYWWNDNWRKCVVVRTSDGRIASIAKGMDSSCNETGHDVYNHSNQSDEDIAFARGKNDGLYHMPYHNIYGSQIEMNAYSRGYTKGSEERNHQTSYHSGYGGTSQYFDTNSLYGKSQSEAFNKLKNNGFVETDKREQNDRMRYLWYNNSTRQCVKVIIDRDRVFKVEKSDNCN